MNETIYRSLTPTQRECLRRVAIGLSAKEIAIDLGISFRTAQQYIYSESVKMGVRGGTKAGLAFVAYERAAPIEEVQVAETELETLAGIGPPMAYPAPADLIRQPTSDELREVHATFLAHGPKPLVDAPPAGSGRQIDPGTWRRLGLILAWFLAAPLALAVVVFAYLGLTLVERTFLIAH